MGVSKSASMASPKTPNRSAAVSGFGLTRKAVTGVYQIRPLLARISRSHKIT
jgi:hypothetical protein